MALLLKKYTLVHLVVLKACFENEPLLQAKVVFRNLSEVLCSVVFIGQEKQSFLAASVSEPLVQN